MRLTINHETRYRYETPPTSAIELLRLTPSNSDTQTVRSWRIDVTGDASLRRFEDAFGNITHTFTSENLGEELVILATGTVETSGTSGVITGAREPLPVGVFRRETPATEPTAELRALGAEARAGCDGTTLGFAHTLNRLINERVLFDPNSTDMATSAGDALLAERGVCQDHTHIFLSAARAQGLPARYVAGYQFEDGRAREEHAGHAWAELYVKDLGWVGFDPTSGASTNETYVRVATGLDTFGASPIRGAVYGGGGEVLSVSVAMDLGTGFSSQRMGSMSQSQSQSQ